MRAKILLDRFARPFAASWWAATSTPLSSDNRASETKDSFLYLRQRWTETTPGLRRASKSEKHPNRSSIGMTGCLHFSGTTWHLRRLVQSETWCWLDFWEKVKHEDFAKDHPVLQWEPDRQQKALAITVHGDEAYFASAQAEICLAGFKFKRICKQVDSAYSNVVQMLIYW